MDTVEIVYYTCLNNDCPKHRNVFAEGDPLHEDCARERLWLEGQSQPATPWLWFAIPAALAAVTIGVIMAIRMMRNREFKPPMLREETNMQTWSGANAQRNEREGHPVPPPIG